MEIGSRVLEPRYNSLAAAMFRTWIVLLLVAGAVTVGKFEYPSDIVLV